MRWTTVFNADVFNGAYTIVSMIRRLKALFDATLRTDNIQISKSATSHEPIKDNYLKGIGRRP